MKAKSNTANPNPMLTTAMRLMMLEKEPVSSLEIRFDIKKGRFIAALQNRVFNPVRTS